MAAWGSRSRLVGMTNESPFADAVPDRRRSRCFACGFRPVRAITLSRVRKDHNLPLRTTVRIFPIMSKGQQTRSTILSEAMRAASVEGFQGISIGMPAARLGMSKSGLFAHFGRSEERRVGKERVSSG